MEDAYIGAYFIAVAEVIFSVLFSIAWFVIYSTVGSWLKVQLTHLRLDPSVGIPKRYGPVIVSHMICSVLFVNPFVILYLFWSSSSILDIPLLRLIIAIVYFWVVPVGTDLLIMRLLPRWSRLKWLKYRPPLKRLVMANLAVSVLAFAVASATGIIFVRTL